MFLANQSKQGRVFQGLTLPRNSWGVQDWGPQACRAPSPVSWRASATSGCPYSPIINKQTWAVIKHPNLLLPSVLATNWSMCDMTEGMDVCAAIRMFPPGCLTLDKLTGLNLEHFVLCLYHYINTWRKQLHFTSLYQYLLIPVQLLSLSIIQFYLILHFKILPQKCFKVKKQLGKQQQYYIQSRKLETN